MIDTKPVAVKLWVMLWSDDPAPRSFATTVRV